MQSYHLLRCSKSCRFRANVSSGRTIVAERRALWPASCRLVKPRLQLGKRRLAHQHIERPPTERPQRPQRRKQLLIDNKVSLIRLQHAVVRFGKRGNIVTPTRPTSGGRLPTRNSRGEKLPNRQRCCRANPR